MIITTDNRPIKVSREVVDGIPVPNHTRTWMPVAHSTVLNAVESRLDSTGVTVTDHTYVVSHGGHRMFATMKVGNGTSPEGCMPTVAVRNSSDQAFAAGIAAGLFVICCSNGSFTSDCIALSRKHTTNILNDLPLLVERAVDRLHEMWEHQATQIEAYRQTRLSDVRAHDLVVRAVDSHVVAASAVPDVLREWRTPEHNEFKARNVFSLFNAFTEVAKKANPFTLPQKTQALHRLCDAYVGLN